MPLMVAAIGMAADQASQKSTVFSNAPRELQFSCSIALNAREEALAKDLKGGPIEKQIASASELWQGHSRLYAQKVIGLLSTSPSQTDAFVTLKQTVDTSLKPESILQELREGDYLWGAWLAFLRPHQDIVSELLANLSKKPAYQAETILALGRSGDRRALEPLYQLLGSPDYRTAGDAAQALGYMAMPEAEPKLIEALSRDNGWLKVKACLALGKVGTRQALPALERIAKDKRYAGALSIRDTASSAIEAIVKRKPEPAGTDQPVIKPER